MSTIASKKNFNWTNEVFRHEWPKTLKDMRTHFTTKNEFEKQYILYNYSDQLDNFLKKIIELTQIIWGGGVLFF